MNNVKDIWIKNKMYIYSFFIPFIIMLLGYSVIGVYPFGNKSVLMSDMSGQYIDYHSALYDILKSKQFSELLYSWKIGMGGSFLGIISYYLASPLTLLMLLFDKSNIPEAILLINLIKIGLSGLTFSIFINYYFKKLDIKHLSFSILYALMAYSIVFSQNIMWLDGIYMLPLIIMGIEKVIREDKFIFLSISLAYIFISNFYISYMIGLFVFLYFCISYYSQNEFLRLREIFKKILQFISATLIAIGCAAIIIIPTYYALKSTGNMAGVDLKFDTNFKLLDLIGKMSIGAYDDLMGGLPTIYSGLICIILVPIYFLNSKINIRERISNFILLGIIILSLNISALNLVWHAFDYPTGFVYRYTFVLGFFLLFLSIKSLNSIESIKSNYIVIAVVTYSILMIEVQKNGGTSINDKYILLSIIFVIIYSVILRGVIVNKESKCIFISLITLLIIEITINTIVLIKAVDRQFTYQTRDSYINTIASRQKILLPSLEDEQFHRTESLDIRTRNDGLNIGYNGLTHFSSMNNLKLRKMLSRFGIVGSENILATGYKESFYITDSLLGLKYITTYKNKELPYKKIGESEDRIMYFNDNALKLAYITSNKILDYEVKADTIFKAQNDFMNLMLNSTSNDNKYKKYFDNIEDVNIILENLEYKNDNGVDIYTKIDKSKDASIKVLINNNSIGNYVICVESDYRFNVSVNDKDEYYYDPPWVEPKMFILHENNIKSFKINVITDEIRIRGNGVNDYIAKFNYNQFNKDLKTIKSNEIRDLNVENTKVSGKVYANKDQVLFTTIPYDKGWKAYVDGTKVKIDSVEEAFIVLPLSEGEHEIKLVFSPQGFGVGVFISFISIISLWIVWTYLKKNRQ